MWTTLSRRFILGGAASGVIALAFAKALPVDFSDPKKNLLALLKILGSTNSHDITVSFGTGRVYACTLSGRPPTPLFSTHSVSAIRGQLHLDGSFTLRQHIVGFRTAFETENVIESMQNPLTGENIELPVTNYGVSDTHYGPEGTSMTRANGPAIVTGTVGLRPFNIDDGVLGISDDAVLPTLGPHHPKIDIVTRYAKVSEVADPKIASAGSWFNFSAVDPFRPWLKMSEPGFQIWHVSGRKLRGSDKLPAFIQRVVSEKFSAISSLPEF